MTLSAPAGANPPGGNALSAGAANRIRTCDPVITNDVLYQLSYCGGPSLRSATELKTPAPDIRHRLALQQKRCRERQEPIFDAFSQREPVPAPDRVRSRRSLENALLSSPSEPGSRA